MKSLNSLLQTQLLQNHLDIHPTWDIYGLRNWTWNCLFPFARTFKGNNSKPLETSKYIVYTLFKNKSIAMGYMYPEKDFGTLSGLAAGQPSREPSSQQEKPAKVDSMSYCNLKSYMMYCMPVTAITNSASVAYKHIQTPCLHHIQSRL